MLYHSVVKRRLRQYPFPLCQDHILWDYAKAVQEVSLIPKDISDWYVDSSDKEERLSEKARDCLESKYNRSVLSLSFDT